MNKTIQIFITILVLTLVASFSSVQVVEAAPGSDKPGNGPKPTTFTPPTPAGGAKNLGEGQGNREDKQEQKDQRREQICANFGERVMAKVQRFEHNKGVHSEKYTKLIERLENVVAKLEEKGFDVTKLEADLVELQVLIDAYVQAYADFIASLDFVRGYGCGDTDGDFKDAMASSKDASGTF